MLRAQAEKELGMMIAELDRSNKLIAKYMPEYEQAEADLSLEEKMELITELIKYQRNHAKIKKYQAQQSKPSTKTEKRNFYMAVLKSHVGWKSKDFKGMTFEQIEEKFIPVWKQLQHFVPMNLKTERSEPSQKHQTKDSKELSEEELKKMIEIIHVEEVYIEAVQAKYPIIEWEIYSEEQRIYWKIIRVGNHAEVYQTFEEMLKRFDREDLDRLWSLVKKTFSTTDPTEDKEKELWVELKRLYEPDPRDQLWALQKYMHDPLEWRLYDTCGVHHVSTRRGYEIFMLVEKDYPLTTKGLTTVMLCLILYRAPCVIKGVLRFCSFKDMDTYRDEGMGDAIFSEPFLREVRINARRFEGMITIHNAGCDNEEDEWQEVRISRPMGKDQAKRKGKGVSSAASSTSGIVMEALVRLTVNEYAMVNDSYNIQKGQNLTKLFDIKKKEL
ncbi:hypothetical protein Tco_0945294 [Tanacetum coccineum]